MVFLRVITFFSGCLGLIVIGLGAWTRLADAGLGCPDWPGCYGFVTIPTSPEQIDVANSRFPGSPYELAKAIPEVVHRYFAATLGFLILCISLLAHREKSVSSSIKKLSLFLVLWVLLQGFFGYLTVSLKLWPQIVTAHLLLGFLTASIIWLLYFKLLDEDNRPVWNFSSYTKRIISISTLLVTIQIFLGAWMSTNYASFACSDFPLCQGHIFPETNFLGGFNLFQEIGPNYLGGQMDLESRTAIHLSHRFGAIFVSALIIFLSWTLYKEGYRKITFLLLILLLLQILLGLSNIIFALPLVVAVAHNLGGFVLVTSLIILRLRY